MQNLARFARKVLHRVSRPFPTYSRDSDCPSVTLEGGLPPSNNPQPIGISKKSRWVKLMVLAGEASGDLHAAGLIHQLKKLLPSVTFFGMGGAKMEEEGVELIYHLRDLSLIGFTEPLRKLPFFRRAMGKMTKLLKEREPDLVILVDYPGFNLRFARQVKKRGIPLVYYICPQVWAWGRWRIKKIAKLVDRAIVFFPFERNLYQRAKLRADFVGHPLIEIIREEQKGEVFRRQMGIEKGEEVLGLFPGSREGEVRRILPLMLQAYRLLAKKVKMRAFLALSPNIPLDLVKGYEVEILQGRNYELMAGSSLVLVASGTATIEATILGTPMLIIYRISPLSWLLGRLLVRLPYIGMVNILAGKQLVPELIQRRANPPQIAAAAWRLLNDEGRREEMKRGLEKVKRGLGEPGAYLRAAQIVHEVFRGGRQA